MARRASSGINLPALMGGLLLFILLAAAAYFFLGRKKTSFESADPLSVIEFEAGSKMLAGGVFRAEGTIEDNRVSGSGQVVILKIEEPGHTGFLPIIVTREAKSKGVNLLRGQKYTFLVEIDTDGVAKAQDIVRQ